jgi:hypothetical protein
MESRWSRLQGSVLNGTFLQRKNFGPWRFLYRQVSFHSFVPCLIKQDTRCDSTGQFPFGPVHTSVISSDVLAAASYLRLGNPRSIDLKHTCLRPRCDDVRSRGHRISLRLRSGTVSLDVWTETDANSRTHVNECGTVTCVTVAISTEEMTDVWTGHK